VITIGAVIHLVTYAEVEYVGIAINVALRKSETLFRKQPVGVRHVVDQHSAVRLLFLQGEGR